MEMNTRLQVEHPVTEAITGLDLVEWQLRVAAGEKLPKTQDELSPRGHAVEARLYAEDPQKGFLPSVGKLERLRFPADLPGLRIDTGVREGDTVTPFYDPMIAKVIAWDETREGAIARLARALAHTEIAGIHTNAAFLVRALRNPHFVKGDVDTGFIPRHLEALVPPAAQPAPAILARAALFLVEERVRQTRSSDPWNAQDGFRLSGEAYETIEFSPGGMRHAVRVHHERGGVMAVEIHGEIVVPTHGPAMRLASGDVAVMVDGETATLPLFDPFATADNAAAATDRVNAPMPGKIVQILVKAGDAVKRGQPLAVLEAMKMEHTLSAGNDTKVASVDVAPGDQVGEGALILRFEKPKAAA